ncbi:exosortase H [uncultured Cocleimonas sp.]|uniref:exosortase H n=1 Tax=uncultured Cocleimonas sp. TaxID=1051587 RepID=UPI0026243158|nr:exosortase H [uncultured Cocleimonas sp.]
MRISWFVLVLVVLFTLELLGPVREYVILPFTGLIASVSAAVTQLFDSSVQSHGIILQNINNGTAVSIQPGCNGVEAMICLTAAIVAFPASWKHKLYGLLFGFLAIQALNIVRIISLFYLLQWDKEWFEWAHLYLWQALIILDALIVFIVWVRMLPEPEDDQVEPQAA